MNSYINISRQSGLLKEMNVIANNIANISTKGYRREGAVFSEFVLDVKSNSQKTGFENTVSMGRLGAHFTDFSSGDFTRTGGTYDLAIQGDGFFQVQTPAGKRLTRAGSFQMSADGTLITGQGYRVLDDAGSQIQIPLEARRVAIGGDGTISADGQPLGRIGIFSADISKMERAGDNLWQAKGGARAADGARLVQGFLEGSNVNPIIEIARMIEVQRAYEAGQKLLEMEDQRIGKTLSTIAQSP